MMLIKELNTILRKIGLLLVVLMVCTLTAHSQSVIDSLEQMLNNAKKEGKAAILNELAVEYYSSDLEKSIAFTDEAFELATDLDNKKELGLAIHGYGYIMQRKGDIDQALIKYKEAREILEKADYKEGVAKALNSIGVSYKRMGELKEAQKYYEEALTLSRKVEDKEMISKLYNSLGGLYQIWGEYEKAEDYYSQAAEIKDLIGDMKGKGISFNNMGNLYTQWGNYEKASEYQQKALVIFEKIGFKKGVASCLLNLGLINESMSESLTESFSENVSDSAGFQQYEKAFEYFEKALVICEELGDKYQVSICLNNLGNIYSRTGREEASNYYKRCLEVRTEIGDKKGVAGVLMNIGGNYFRKDSLKEAIDTYHKSLAINQELNDQYETANTLNAIAQVCYKDGDMDRAINYYNDALAIAKEKQFASLIHKNYNGLSDAYAGKNEIDKAFYYYKKYISVKDSLVNEDTHKQITELATKYETAKKEQEIELLNKDKVLQDNQIQQQRIMIFVFVCVSVVILIFLILLFRMFKQKKKANIELAIKNHLITEQKQEITDSIHYAKRIQTAILPPEDNVSEDMPEHFVLFKPKDIVSGDFHWSTIKGDRIIMSAADCTGHGVPGAFMSMLGVSFLNEIVNDKGITDSGKILDALRDSIIKSLQQTGKEGEAKDGMDMALCTYNVKTMELLFSGANNPLYIIRSGELSEIKGDKMPVAIYLRMDSFKTHELQMKKGDMIYMFSDGFADQFGGPKGKKFKYKPFKQLLLDKQDEPMAAQKLALNEAIEKWKEHVDPLTNEPYEQVDDICIIGMRL